MDVHGLDLSSNSLAHARRIADADGAQVTWVEGDARTASQASDRRFEVVVTSAGTIVWLPELRSWARSQASSLNNKLGSVSREEIGVTNLEPDGFASTRTLRRLHRHSSHPGTQDGEEPSARRPRHRLIGHALLEPRYRALPLARGE
ncbi:hypothetical protein GCM10009800_52390 [Nocardiopsis rhodophaea]